MKTMMQKMKRKYCLGRKYADTTRLYILIWLIFNLLTLTNFAKAQSWLTTNAAGSGGTVDVFFRLDYGDVVFTSDGYCDMYDYAPDGVYRPGYGSTFYTQPRFKVGWNADGTPTTKYRITSDGNPTTHTIVIHTANTQPTGPVGPACNQGKTYDIYLYDINVDRSMLPNPLGNGSGMGNSYGSLASMQQALDPDHTNTNTYFTYNNKSIHKGPTVFAGDNTVNVNLILCGPRTDGGSYTEFVGGFTPTTNSITFKGEPGVHAVIEYDAFPTDGGWKGEQGSGKLTISQHPASTPATMTVEKDGTHNAGSGIGGLLGSAVVANGPIEFNSGIINVSIGGHSGISGQADIYGGYGAAIGSGACSPVGDITINGGTITATSVATTAAIGAGGGYGSPGGSVTGTIAINGGTVTTYSQGNQTTDLMGVGIGAGGSNYQEAGSVGDALNDTGGKILITGGTVNVWKLDKATNSYVPGNIGGGHANVGTLDTSHSSFVSSNGGDARIEIHGGTVNAGFIGGGGTYTDQTGYNGGMARVTIGNNTYAGATINVTEGIAGGDSKLSGGGDAIITVNKGSLTTGTICGGTCLNSGDLGKATVTITGGTIQGQFLLSGDNSSSSDHCSFTMTGGTIDNSNLGAIGATEYARLKDNGGAIYMEDPYGEVSISGGVIKNCSGSTLGGAIYMTDGHLSLSGTGKIQNCSATQSGGAAYLVGGLMTMDGGVIENNYAALSGGGIYIPATGRLVLKGNALVTGNHVPSGRLGGGIYLAGAVEVGSASKAPSTITIQDNYADAAGATITDLNRNNIYLPNPTVNNNHTDVITVVNGGLDLTNSSIGLSVPSNFVPVIYCASTTYLSPTILNTSAIFEDSHSYEKYYTTGSDGYDPNHVYLAADTWVLHQSSTPSSGFSVSGNDVTVSSKEGLAWLISYVNNFNGVTGDHTNVDVTLTADIDMSDHKWVPIGYAGKEFKGTFDGGGHTITGINCSYIKGTGGTGTSLGLFGATDGASIHDVFVTDANLMVRNQTSDTYSMGGIVGSNNGTVYNCTASSNMESTWSNTTMGGLVGKLTGGTIHSSAAMSTITGYTMGGLAGTNAGNIYNSFANSKFTHSGSGTEYVGGLVGVNAGTVENCYVREQAGSSHGSNFGWCVGDNSGAIAYCYIPQGETMYKANGTDQGNTCTTYGPTATPYSYRHTDNQMAENANNAKIVNGSFDRDGNPRGLLSTLNKWVSDNSGHGYATWMRTMGSPINDDYPIFHRTDAVCVGSEDNVALEYSADFNSKFGDYIKANTGTIYLYSTPARLVVGNATQDYNVDETNSGKNVQLHIGKGVSLVPNSGKAITNANVNVWLDNSAGTNGASPVGHTDAIDWHFFSSVLSNAPIGLNYPTGETPYGTEPTQAQFTDADGYFPLNLNSYYSEWDLYAYSEPDYHWINLKRNSQSHWHEDFDHGPINYTNETTFTPGKGYMVALAEEGYLQAYGTLNSHPDPEHPLEVSINYTTDISWTTRQGHNLLGNPYQSYLDFNKFAEYNSGLWEDNDYRKAGYVIMDEDQKDYIYYSYGASVNTYTAPMYLHPHQGFMVIVNKPGLTAKFDDRMRNVDATGVTFRDGQPRYPLVNLFATDDNGNRDMVTVELGRPDKGGALKQGALRTSTGNLSCHYEGEDYALVFTQPGLESANIRFSTDADAAYTMTWDAQNGEFGYLHLVDNLTGADIDCLTASEYKFTSRTSDYASRFKLVFEYTGIEEQEDAGHSDGPTAFAYYANGEIHLTDSNDDASLQIIDMTGRTVASRDAVPASATLSTDGMAAGIYVLRLTDRNGTRTQKIVIQ